MQTKTKVVLGLSGGVDSSVCAYLLKKNGYDVIGLFMQNWDPYVNNDFLGHKTNDAKKCDAQKDFSDALVVGKKLNINVYYTEFIEKYWNDVFKYVIEEYKKGNTPNPDILCNKYIKFDAFFKYAFEHFQCDYIAMGHYANVEYKNNEYFLKKSKDKLKDQTYFLCWLNQKQLSKIIFPIGNLLKKDVRKIAKNNNLDIWNKKDSTGICFIGERKFKDFLKNYIDVKPGKIIDIQTNKVVGKHDGIMFYTLGQNKSLGLSGQKDKYYVCKKDTTNNIIYVVNKQNKDLFLSSTQCLLSKFNWINDYHLWINKRIKVRFRHTGELIDCKFEIKNKDQIILRYKSTINVTPGQFAVLYCNNYCLGGGIIDSIR